MPRKQARFLNLIVLLAMILSFVTGPATVTNAASSSANAAGQFASGNIVVYRVGDGSASLVNTGNPVYLDEYKPDGTLVQSIAMPVTVSGSNKSFYANGTSSSEGLLTRSVDEHYLLLSGYVSTSASSLSSTTGTAVNRVVGRVDASGNIDTTTALVDFASIGSPRSVASTNGTDLWIAGGTGGGALYHSRCDYFDPNQHFGVQHSASEYFR